MNTYKDLSRFGHHLIIGISGPVLSDADKRLLNVIKPAGIVLFARNFVQGVSYDSWLETLATLLSDIYEYSERSTMFITLDHEGGSVVRTPLPITRFPHAILYKEYAREVALATGQQIRSLGVNVSWAPVADIHSNPANPVIGARAFGNTPESVTKYALEYMEGLRDSGLLTCAKHFPGHGDTSTDSHYELPVVNSSMDELMGRELKPFTAMVEHGVPFVMTAHILYPKIDPKRPATLSPLILKKLLREEMNFKGIVVSDDLDMKAVSDSFSKADTLTDAFNAGCDMFIIARNPNPNGDRTEVLSENFYRSLKEGSLSEDTVEESKARVDKILNLTPTYSVQRLEADTLLEHYVLSLEIACQ